MLARTPEAELAKKRGPARTRPEVTLERFNMTQFQLALVGQGLALVYAQVYNDKPAIKEQILSLASRFRRSVASDG